MFIRRKQRKVFGQRNQFGAARLGSLTQRSDARQVMCHIGGRTELNHSGF